MQRSIRRTFGLWYVGSVGVILVLFSAALYRTLDVGLHRALDQTLRLQAENVADSVFAFWRAERSVAGAGPGNWVAAPYRTFAEAAEQGDFSGLLMRWAEKTEQLDTGRPVRLIDRRFEPLTVSPSFGALGIPLTAPVRANLDRLRPTYDTHRLPGRQVRVMTYPVQWGGRLLYGVQVAASLQETEAALARLRTWLGILVPATLVVTLGLGWLLAGTALAPITRLIAQTRQFMHARLREPLPAPHQSDEITQLTTVVNRMLLRLERAFRRLRQFSAAAAHELRTTLTVMQGDIGVALRRLRSPQEYEALLQGYLTTLKDMSSTVEELLQLAQWDAAGDPLERRSTEFGRLVRETCAGFASLASQRGVRLDVAAPDACWLEGDRRLLARVVANLLDNALKHTPSAGCVTVRVERQDVRVRLTVRDTGPGIPAEELPTIFDRFFQPRASDDAPSTGVGLGLCRWIVEGHQGRLSVASTPGHGATFIVHLPLSPAPATDPPSSV